MPTKQKVTLSQENTCADPKCKNPIIHVGEECVKVHYPVKHSHYETRYYHSGCKIPVLTDVETRKIISRKRASKIGH